MMIAIRDRWCIGGWVAGRQVLVEAGRAAKALSEHFGILQISITFKECCFT